MGRKSIEGSRKAKEVCEGVVVGIERPGVSKRKTKERVCLMNDV